MKSSPTSKAVQGYQELAYFRLYSLGILRVKNFLIFYAVSEKSQKRISKLVDRISTLKSKSLRNFQKTLSLFDSQ